MRRRLRAQWWWRPPFDTPHPTLVCVLPLPSPLPSPTLPPFPPRSYKGIGPTIVSGAPYTGLQMTAYELLQRNVVVHDGSTHTGLGWQLFNGAMAGLVAQTCECIARGRALREGDGSEQRVRAVGVAQAVPRLIPLACPPPTSPRKSPTSPALGHPAVMYPGDTVRRRMQNNGAGGAARIYRNSFHCSALIYRNEGMRGFFKGAWTNTVR
jgi:hypothetical protein